MDLVDAKAMAKRFPGFYSPDDCIIDLLRSKDLVKVSNGQPKDKDGDLESDIWAGILPIKTSYGEPIPADNLRPGIPIPDYIATWVVG